MMIFAVGPTEPNTVVMSFAPHVCADVCIAIAKALPGEYHGDRGLALYDSVRMLWLYDADGEWLTHEQLVARLTPPSPEPPTAELA